ncbi:hypothetical protein IHE31_09340 [Mycetohabitans rhizoxinica]
MLHTNPVFVRRTLAVLRKAGHMAGNRVRARRAIGAEAPPGALAPTISYRRRSMTCRHPARTESC